MLRAPSNTPWPVIPRTALPRRRSFGNQLRSIQRSHGILVDEMALHVELGVETRKALTAPVTRRAHTSATPTPPTPSTKYRPPVALMSLVARERLADALRAAGRRRLILINAPSGYGKSTLAAQWRELLIREGVAVAWLTVDDDDNNAVWFLAHLLESIRTIRTRPGGVLDSGARRARRRLGPLRPDVADRRDTRKRRPNHARRR